MQGTNISYIGVHSSINLCLRLDSLSGLFEHSNGAHSGDRPSATDSRYDRGTTLASFNVNLPTGPVYFLLILSTQSLGSQRIISPSATAPTAADSPAPTQHKVIESASDGVTIFNFLAVPPALPGSENNSLPELPSEGFANAFLETTYIYTQGRYCLVDWVQVRQWHQNRESICKAARLHDAEAQTGLSMSAIPILKNSD